jgi:hypothetical protein
VTAGHKVKGDFRMKERLKEKLIGNEENIRKELIEMNQLDIALYDYAQSLMSFRLKHYIPVIEKIKKKVIDNQKLAVGKHIYSQEMSTTTISTRNLQVQIGNNESNQKIEELNLQCPVTAGDISTRKTQMQSTFKPLLGVFQPPGHKGP